MGNKLHASKVQNKLKREALLNKSKKKVPVLN
jgi:hypothetical protein